METRARLSIPALGEIDAKAAHQRQILRDQKFPSELKGMFYKEAAEAAHSARLGDAGTDRPVREGAAVRLLVAGRRSRALRVLASRLMDVRFEIDKHDLLVVSVRGSGPLGHRHLSAHKMVPRNARGT
jgi:hypothetical protein